jgi:hypothetical protein
LHVLSTPPAFVLSQDQTLQQKTLEQNSPSKKHPTPLANKARCTQRNPFQHPRTPKRALTMPTGKTHQTFSTLLSSQRTTTHASAEPFPARFFAVIPTLPDPIERLFRGVPVGPARTQAVRSRSALSRSAGPDRCLRLYPGPEGLGRLPAVREIASVPRCVTYCTRPLGRGVRPGVSVGVVPGRRARPRPPTPWWAPTSPRPSPRAPAARWWRATSASRCRR